MKISQRGQMRDLIERANEATKIQKREKKENKKREGGNTTILILEIHTCASK